MSSIKEYIYIDEKRLNTYFEQISSPVTYDKVPVWKASASLTGPKASVDQSRVSRQYTTHEKATLLLEYLKKNKQLSENRPGHWDTSPMFRLETFQATRFKFNTASPKIKNNEVLKMWISPRESICKRTGVSVDSNLYLLEDFPRDDGKEWNWSSYSIFYALSKELIEEETHFENPLSIDIYNNPSSVLNKLDKQVGPPRLIKCLYRIRATFLESWDRPEEPAGIFAYPIFIIEEDL